LLIVSRNGRGKEVKAKILLAVLLRLFTQPNSESLGESSGF